MKKVKHLKLTAKLLATTFMASFVLLPQTGNGLDQLEKRQAAQRHAEQQQAALQAGQGAEIQRQKGKKQGYKARVAAKKVKIANLKKYKEAMQDPGAILNAAGPETLTQALTHAVTVVGSAVHNRPIGTVKEKIQVADDILNSNAASDVAANFAIRTVLGIDPDPANFAGTVNDAIEFLDAAHERLHLAPKSAARKAEARQAKNNLADLGVFIAALGNPASFAPGTDINQALRGASIAPHGDLRGEPYGTAAEVSFFILELERTPDGGVTDNERANDAAKSAIRVALHLNDDPAEFANTRGAVVAYAKSLR